ncbi:hypothetical protein UPYG_G00174440 [Umbra pygmaea]|uniref:TNFR-Cys domain-containing protein n=1 Tax=Umbra pygmaea TaxID=75934 RepID=A0ABD0WU10_UMBPY
MRGGDLTSLSIIHKTLVRKTTMLIIMDTQYTLMTCLLIFGTMGVALDPPCNKTSCYEKNNLCCNLCPAGTFVKKDCTAKVQTKCEACPNGFYSEANDHMKECIKCNTCQHVDMKCTSTANAICSCPGILCLDTYCTKCVQMKCSKGEELNRTGEYEFIYKCDPCPNNTYSDTEDGVCKPLTKCEANVSNFLGNKTHNAQCGTPALPKEEESPGLIQITWVTGFFFFGFSFLMFASLVCIWLTRNKHTVNNCPPTRNSIASQDICGCPLSKEETVGQHIQKAESKDNSSDGLLYSRESIGIV